MANTTMRYFGSVKAFIDHDRCLVVLSFSPVLAPLQQSIRAACLKWAADRLGEEYPTYEIIQPDGAKMRPESIHGA